MKKRKTWVFFYFLTIAGVLLAAQWGSRAVTVIAESRPIEREHCIVIDPGHGGEDGGATSCTGLVESTYNLDISLRLNDLLHLLGHDTQMTRTTDISIYTKGGTIAQKKASDLKERVRIVNETENALLISIHQNNFSDSRYSGAQVFYAGTEGSAALAKQLQSALVAALNPGSSRKSKIGDGIYLMEHIDCPGVLIECGFLSNAAEEARLRNAEYQKKLCCVIAATVSEYLSNT
ncbi:MAG: N-acetylmuramoyl-L-alanine amidase [Faecousia sp.]